MRSTDAILERGYQGLFGSNIGPFQSVALKRRLFKDFQIFSQLEA